METIIEMLNDEIEKIESEGNPEALSDDYLDGEVDGLILAIRIIKQSM